MTLSHNDPSDLIIKKIDQRTLDISGKQSGTYELIITIHYRMNKLAVIKVVVTVSKLESIELDTIGQPVAGASFRIHPRFRVGR